MATEAHITDEQRFQRPTANTYYKFEDASEEEEVDFRIAELENDTEENDTENADTAVCPECGRKVEHEGGCVVCRNCGYSKCG